MSRERISQSLSSAPHGCATTHADRRDSPRAPSGTRDAYFSWNVLSSFARDFAQVRRCSTLNYTLVGIAVVRFF
jgi:hypothetical protein